MRGEIFIDIKSSITLDDNIYVSNIAESDQIAKFQPGVLYIKNDGLLVIRAYVNSEITRYLDNSESDSDDFKTGITLSYPNMKGSEFFWAGNWSLTETSTALSDDPINPITETTTHLISSNLRYEITDLYAISFFNSYSKKDEKSRGNIDSFAILTSLSGTYHYSDRLDLSINLRQRHSDFATGPNDTDDYAIYLGADGTLLSNIQGEVDFGIQHRKGNNIKDDFTYFMDSKVKWPITSLTAFQIGATSDYNSTPGGTSKREQSTTGSVILTPDTKISIIGGITYSVTDYSDVISRKDDSITFTADGKYIFTEKMNSFFSLSHKINDSTLTTSEYDRMNATIGLSFLY